MGSVLAGFLADGSYSFQHLRDTEGHLQITKIYRSSCVAYSCTGNRPRSRIESIDICACIASPVVSDVVAFI